MLRLTSFLAAVLAATLPSLAGGADAGEPASGLLRTTLTVADVDRSAAFYGELGFRVEEEMGGERNPDSAFPLNARSTRWRLLVLAPASGQGGRIGLLSFADAPPAPTRELERERVGLGDMVFVIEAPDAEALHARMKEAGARIVEAPFSFRSRSVRPDGSPKEGRIFHLFDPDGYLIEVLQPAR